jgi:hypothetical protein
MIAYLLSSRMVLVSSSTKKRRVPLLKVKRGPSGFDTCISASHFVAESRDYK